MRKSSAPIKLWLRLTLPGVGQIGPGKIELLRKIREYQSISAAAREMKMSYRRAWLLVDDLNAAFRRPVVVKWMGGSSRGGAKLAPTARSSSRATRPWSRAPTVRIAPCSTSSLASLACERSAELNF